MATDVLKNTGNTHNNCMGTKLAQSKAIKPTQRSSHCIIVFVPHEVASFSLKTISQQLKVLGQSIIYYGIRVDSHEF